MDLDFHLVNIFILFGAIQGLVFIGIIIFHQKHPGRTYLALIMVALVYNALETFSWSAGLDKYILFFDFFPFVTIFLIGPGFYLYFKSLLDFDYKPTTKELLLFFSPFLFQFTFTIVKSLGYIAYFKMNFEFIGHPLKWMFTIYDSYSEILSLVVFLYFTLISILLVKKNILKANLISRNKSISSWIKSLLMFQFVLAISWTMTLMAPIWYSGSYGSHYYPIELFLVFFLYWSAMSGYGKVKSIQKYSTTKPDKSYHKASGILEALEEAMTEDKLFLNSNLKLQMVADHLGIASKEISFILNQKANTNFNDFVNNKRIEAFCKRIKNENTYHFSIFGLAQECGFKSPATFQRAFKKVTNMSPKNYVEKFGSKPVI